LVGKTHYKSTTRKEEGGKKKEEEEGGGGVMDAFLRHTGQRIICFIDCTATCGASFVESGLWRGAVTH
jgi:hypothetical protein